MQIIIKVILISYRVTTPHIIEKLTHYCQKWRIDIVFFENDMIYKALVPFLREKWLYYDEYIRIIALPHHQDKRTKAMVFQALMEQGRVFFNAHDTNQHELLRELWQFPYGKHDDMVDTCSLIGRALDKLTSGTLPEQYHSQKSYKPAPGHVDYRGLTQQERYMR